MSGLVPLLVPSALAAVRRPRCGGIEAADRVLLVGEPATGVLVIYPLASLDALLPGGRRRGQPREPSPTPRGTPRHSRAADDWPISPLPVHTQRRAGQMVLGFLTPVGRDNVVGRSGGQDPPGDVYPAAIEAMAERGIDISQKRRVRGLPAELTVPVKH